MLELLLLELGTVLSVVYTLATKEKDYLVSFRSVVCLCSTGKEPRQLRSYKFGKSKRKSYLFFSIVYHIVGYHVTRHVIWEVSDLFI